LYNMPKYVHEKIYSVGVIHCTVNYFPF
jgi:hypothetical protein